MRIVGAVAVVILVGCTPLPTGPFTRARADAEPAGQNCELGGVAINTGVAAEDSRTVTDDEITATMYLCKLATPPSCAADATTFHGSVTIPIPADETEKLRNVTCIDGDLLVLDIDEPEGNGLGDLEMVTGNVAFAGDPYLLTIDGFPHLREVGGTFLLQGNDGLGDLHGLSALSRVGELAVVANAQLPDLAGLELATISSSLTVAANPELTSLYGIDTLTTTGAVMIDSNAALSTLAALDQLTTVGALTISNDPALVTFEPHALAAIGGDLAIASNAGLSSVRIPTVTIGGGASFDSNPALARIDAPELRTAAAFHAADDPKLATVSAPTAASIDELVLSKVPALAAVDMHQLATVDALTLDHTGFVDLGGFALQSLNTLSVSSCSSFSSLHGLEPITMLQSFEVTDTAVSSFTGLDKLTAVTGDFTFTGNTLRGAPVQLFVQRLNIGGKVSVD